MTDTVMYTATITIPRSELGDFTVEDVREGIEARLFPVASCHPDEIIASAVEVTVA